MKILNNIYSHYQMLSWLSVRILQATLCIFCATLLCVIILILFPEIVNNHVQNNILIDELLNSSTRLLTLGSVTAFASDIIVRK